MKNYEEYFTDSINHLKSQNRYRNFVEISRLKGQFPHAINKKNGRKIVVWCSNDYLGMGQNESAINKAISCLKENGLGSGGTRNISGSSVVIAELENDIAKLYEKERALSFVSGYIANDASIQALAKIIPNLVVFSDAKNHASIIAGIRNSRVEKNIFKHNDMKDLEANLQKYSLEVPKLIIFESVYSMDGDFGKAKEIVALAKKYNAMTFCDEVHGVGLYGDKGQGLCAEIGVLDQIDIIQGTFAKAYGVIGGFIVGKNNIIDAIRLNASGFIFSTSLPPFVAAAIRENVAHLKASQVERLKHKKNIASLKNALENAGIEIVKNQSHIVSIRICDAFKAQEISRKLLDEFDIYVQHINFPTVAIGDERLRITITPLHNEKMIADLVKAIKHCI